MTAPIAMYFLGGTISMSSSDGQAVRPTLGADDLLAAIPGLDAVDADLTGETLAREQSGSLTPTHLLDMLTRATESDADGFVLVQGTDTLEESAYLLDLLWADERPVVVTGAMRNPTVAGADGAANMLAGIRVAASPDARGLGVMAVFSDEIHAARHVTKGDTSSLTTFVSPNTGPIGRVLEGHVHLFHRPQRREALPQPTALDAEIPVVTSTLGQSARALDALGTVADAIVVRGFGAGHVPGWWAEAMGDLATRIPVVMTSRTASGPALTQTYGAIGAEVDLQARGVVMGGYLNALQARLLTMVVLANGGGVDEVADEIRRRGDYR